MRLKAIFVSALVACAARSPALAQECGPLKLITEVQMISPSGGYSHLVPVTVNDVPKLMLLDTGGFMSQLTQDTATELQLALRDSAVRLYDVSGNVARQYAVAEKFSLGSLVAQRQPFFVSPSGLGGTDGLIATDLMLNYDIDIDFGAGKLRYFSPDHCPGKVVYWKPAAVAAVPITIKDKFHISVPVRLDGVELDALIDTGAMRTTMSLHTARTRFDVTPDSPGVVKAGM